MDIWSLYITSVFFHVLLFCLVCVWSRQSQNWLSLYFSVLSDWCFLINSCKCSSLVLKSGKIHYGSLLLVLEFLVPNKSQQHVPDHQETLCGWQSIGTSCSEAVETPPWRYPKAIRHGLGTCSVCPCIGEVGADDLRVPYQPQPCTGSVPSQSRFKPAFVQKNF